MKFIMTALCLLPSAVLHDFSPLRAQQALSLAELTQRLVLNNGTYLASLTNVAISKDLAAQKTSLPDPQFGYTLFGQSVETRVGPQRQVFSLAQQVPLWNKRGLRKDIDLKQGSIWAAESDWLKRSLVHELQIKYLELCGIRMVTAQYRNFKNALQGFERIAATRYSTGGTDQQALLRIQLESSTLDLELAQLEQDERTVINSIYGLLNEDSVQIQIHTPSLRFSDQALTEDELLAQALEDDPGLIGLEQQLEKQQLLLRLSQAEKLPDIRLGVTYIDVKNGTTVHKDDGRNAYAFQIGFNLPLWTGKYTHRDEERRNMIRTTNLEQRDRRSRIQAGIGVELSRLEKARRTIRLFESALIPQATRVAETSIATYKTGRLDFSNLLEDQRTIFKLQVGRIEALTEYWQTMAALEKLSGQSLLKL